MNMFVKYFIHVVELNTAVCDDIVNVFKEVDLRYSSGRQLYENAAETARLIHLVNKVDNFEERYPAKIYHNVNGNDAITPTISCHLIHAAPKRTFDVTIDVFTATSIKGTDRHDLDVEYEDEDASLKLLNNKYDIARKLNDLAKDVNVQYISNPEVLDAYKNLPEEHTDTYEDSVDQDDTQRSYAEELEGLHKIPLYHLRRSKKYNKNKSPKSLEMDESDDLDSSSDNSDNDENRVNDIQRRGGEDQDSADAETFTKYSEEAEKNHLKSKEKFNIVEPFIETMLNRYKGNPRNREKDISIESGADPKASNRMTQEDDKKYNIFGDSKRISTKRRAAADWEDKVEDENKKWVKEDDWDKNDRKKKADDGLNKNKDDFNEGHKVRSKNEDDWNKENIDWSKKDESKKKDNWDEDDDYDSKKKKIKRDKPKRDSAWDNIGADKNTNTEWGNYAPFKNLQDKKNSYENDNVREEKRKPAKIEVETKVKRYQSWDRPSKREDYYERPRKKHQIRSPYRTPIPFSGKKAVYAD